MKRHVPTDGQWIDAPTNEDRIFLASHGFAPVSPRFLEQASGHFFGYGISLFVSSEGKGDGAWQSGLGTLVQTMPLTEAGQTLNSFLKGLASTMTAAKQTWDAGVYYGATRNDAEVER